MPTVYTPSPVALSSLTLAVDGEARTVASVNGPLKKLGDAIKYLIDHASILEQHAFYGGGAGVAAVTGNIVAPTGCLAALVRIWASGGAGGQGGTSGWDIATQMCTGGGGGGGSQEYLGVVPIVGGGQYDYALGAAVHTGDGNDSTFTRHSDSVVLCSSFAAGFGSDGVSNFATNEYYFQDPFPGVVDGTTPKALRNVAYTVKGGEPFKRTYPNQLYTRSHFLFDHLLPRAGEGGRGRDVSSLALDIATVTAGGRNGRFLGGAGGNHSGQGGPGGGGGAGPNGPGAAGGNGAVSSSGPGGAGQDAGAGTGAGGGGGGGAGSSSGSPGAGGWSGSGGIEVWWLRPAP